MDMYFLAWMAGGALLFSVALTPLAMRMARRLGILDLPGTRRLHVSAVPRIGGVAIAGSIFLVGGGGMVWANYHEAIRPDMMAKLMTIGLAGIFVFVVGLVDDVRPVPSRYKALALLSASAAVCGAGVRIDAMIWNSGTEMLELAWLSWPVTIMWIAAVTVAIAFIDGMDGLAAGLVMIASATIVASCVTSGHIAEAVLPLLLFGALIGFTLYNANPAVLFMGDSGSLTIGFLVACAMVLAAPAIGSPRGLLLPALALSIPLLDLGLTLFRRRFINRQISIFSAEMGHIHHHMAQLGLSQAKTVFILCAVSVMAVAIGEISLMAKGWAMFGVLSLVVPLLLGLFHVAGSVRVRGMVAAVKRKRALDREEHRYASVADELQVRLRTVAQFSEWWQAVCDCAAALNFAAVKLPLHHRNGQTSDLCWNQPDDRFADCETLNATVPIRDRRRGELLRAEVKVYTTHSLESAGHRLSLFTHLMADHSAAELPDPAAVNPDGRFQRSTYPDADQTLTVEIPPPPRQTDTDKPRVALVHDFLYVYAGAERVLEQMLAIYPDADIFSLFDFLPEDQRQFLGDRPVTTSFLQRMPLASKKHRAYLPLMPLAIEQLDVSAYDIVISSSYMAAKGVITGPDQLHVCYCHSPARYAWDLQHQYLNQNNLGYSPRALLVRAILHYIRNWDVRSAAGVDQFVANSHFIARRINKCYRRQAQVIYPPVNVDQFEIGDVKGDYYVCLSRLVPYKQTELIVRAFNRMPEHQLLVIGDGPQYKHIAEIAGPNVRMLGRQPSDQIAKYLQMAKATVFAAEEDFGIVPVESMACGTPVIAFSKGGATETIIDGKTGLFFHEQTPFAIINAVKQFEQQADRFDPVAARQRARQFGVSQFHERFSRFVDQAWQAHLADRRPPQDHDSRSAQSPVGAPADRDATETNAAESIATVTETK
jgi:UDP-N-acetylmuramyl pentapeptide phosphotransferase/UDP-N-acetylglucosamine-1-phosphate transferase/glycosyltransferase involved in cell wall biosynthesis